MTEHLTVYDLLKMPLEERERIMSAAFEAASNDPDYEILDDYKPDVFTFVVKVFHNYKIGEEVYLFTGTEEELNRLLENFLEHQMIFKYGKIVYENKLTSIEGLLK